MSKSAMSAALVLGLAASMSFAVPPTDQRTREEFSFLCTYKPENGVTLFLSPKCGHPDQIASTPAANLRAAIDLHWAAQPEMRYRDLTMLNYRTAFNRAFPPEKEPPPTTDEIKRFDISLLCEWWRETGNEQIFAEITARKIFTPKDLQLIRAREVAIGMTEPALLCSWGAPEARNRTATAAGMHIRYVFRLSPLEKERLVYTENGIVTSWQD